MTPETTAAQTLQSLLDEERTRTARLEQANAALIAEFADCANFDQMRDKARKSMNDLAPAALTQIGLLMQHSESESVRASLSKWCVELLLSDKLTDTGEESLKGLLDQLKKNDPVQSNNSREG